MRATEHRIRIRSRSRALAAPAPVSPTARRAALGLNALELEDLLVAIGDLEDREADPGRRARLARSRAALELELARTLEA